MPNIFSPYILPSGTQLPNRIVKAAMEESLGTDTHTPGPRMIALYRTWAKGGTGTLITGNVMVHDAALTGPKALVLDEKQPLEPFTRWADAAHESGATIWMQINHPGRQVLASQPGIAWAPSALKVDVGSKQAEFAQPEAMTQEQIRVVVGKFITTATLAEQAGFDGVEVHAAHGYLLSQFLSPRTNLRDDEWGGSLHNRARIVRTIVEGIRERVSANFVVAVKLNSSDFQKGGFSADDARQVISMLNESGADLVELSGGSYESPAMTGNSADEHTHSREAYFLDLAEDLIADSPLPLMVTGGIVRPQVAREVLDSGVPLFGMGTALAASPDLPLKWKNGEEVAPSIPRTSIKNKAVASAASMAWVRWQMSRIARGKRPLTWVDPRIPLVGSVLGRGRDSRKYGQWLDGR